MMLGHTGNAKKASSKFQDSDSRMTRPRAVSELPQRSSPRLNKAAAGSEAGGGAPRRPVGVRVTAPRSPLHEKKPVVAGAGAGSSRVAELEAKLEKAHGQLTEMREQLSAAEKARKDARAALVEAKKRDGVAAPAAVQGVVGNKVLVAATQPANVEVNANDQDDCIVPTERESNNEAKDDGEVGNVVSDGDDGEKGSQYVDELRAKLVVKNMEVDEMKEKLMVKDMEIDELRAKLITKDIEVYELRAKLMVRDTEVDELMRDALTTKDAELDELRSKLASNTTEISNLKATLTAKDTEIEALEADNADLTKAAEEAGEAAKASAARARETERALRESAAREARAAEALRASERAREAMEAEAQRSRVHTEQWRKAAEEAAFVIGGVERDAPGAPAGAVVGTPRADRWCQSSMASGVWTTKGGEEDGAGGKRKSGAAMRVLSDLWKKKAQK
ncbi:hypothetical protein QOZ80_5BG0414450 [Eleusine coracana subsp. coracana]|nr:hypothetical protein QOZ80_5BG0414450 [Eleusine coracana subsp. coracana]